MRVDRETLLRDPVGSIAAAFAPDGPMAAAMPGYRPNPDQVRYATILMRAAVRGTDPATAGRVTPLEGGTGIGKSVAILVVAGLCSVLLGKRALVTTYTRALGRQLVGRDGGTAADVVEAMTGTRPLFAVRRPRSAFASPSTCRNHAHLAGIEAVSADAERATALRTQKKVLERLADWTDAALVRADAAVAEGMEAVLDYMRGFDGLVETFTESDEEARLVVASLPIDFYALEADSPDGEQSGWTLYNVDGAKSHVLLATHHAAIIDQNRYGSVLDPDGLGWSLVVMDEGNRLEDAGRLALGTKRALSSYGRDAESLRLLLEAVADDETSEGVRHLLAAHDAIAVRLLAALSRIAGERRNQRDDVRLSGSEPWLDDLRALEASVRVLSGILRSVGSEAADAAVARMRTRSGDVSAILEAARRLRVKAESGQRTVDRKDAPYGDVHLSFTPQRTEPSLHVRPRRGARVISRFWSNPQGPSADALVVTSATLGNPLPGGRTNFSSIQEAIGVREPGRVNTDLAASIEMKRFGTLRQLVLAHPRAPLPTKAKVDRIDGETLRSPEWLEYAAQGILAAARDVWRDDGRNRVVVLCNSFDEADALDELVSPGLDEGEANLRTKLQSVHSSFDWLERRTTGVLFAVGSYDGVDRPGLIDHLVIPRLPFVAPEGAPYRVGWTDKETGEQREGETVERMKSMLRQGFGRPFRKADDEAKIWILDARIGLPRAAQRGGTLFPNPASGKTYLDAVPTRFEKAVAKAVVFEIPGRERNAA